ncbi:class I SAM-dependent methyltransferase [Phaeobacter gallaeciensis]|uniref:class I SAM-dependent methyltransferase n=1 Tax=Phaeobacter gallaeciensis TaxID=60890 RepID=UPI001FCFE296|nr:class I SAM-dependent methyltransferase [Phaeobacter gallaeciensis]
MPSQAADKSTKLASVGFICQGTPMSMCCSLCQEENLVKFIDLGRQPLANKYPRPTDFEEEKFFSLEVFFCVTCKNVQLGEMVPRALMFEDYYYLSSVNGGLVRHFEALAEDLQGAEFIVDIGSNDGVLLRPLKQLGVCALGIEPSVNVSKIANDEGLETICAFFDEASARQVVNSHGEADVIVASSVFTHLDAPDEFIRAADILLTETGKLVIEVEYILNMINQLQYERFYLDRIFYYSISSMKTLFGKHGMVITQVEPVAQHGGSLRFTLMREAVGSQASELDELIATELEVLNSEALMDFGQRCRSLTDNLVAGLKSWRDAGVKVAGYGAPARLSTITNFGGIDSELLPFTVDDSPLKQGRTSPGAHIPVVAASELETYQPEVLVVFAYEYIDDIREKTGNAYDYYMPIPLVELKAS